MEGFRRRDETPGPEGKSRVDTCIPVFQVRVRKPGGGWKEGADFLPVAADLEVGGQLAVDGDGGADAETFFVD